MLEVRNQSDLEAALNDAASRGGGISFDGSVDPVKVDGTLEVRLKDLGETGPQIFFNGLRIESTNRDGATTCLRFKGNVKRLTLADLNVFGNAYDTPGCGLGIEVISENGAVWLSTFRNIQSSWCGGSGMRFDGEVFENSFYSLDAKDNRGNGIEFSNQHGIVSNCMLYGTNASRNIQAGFALLDGCGSVDLWGGSMITNGSCGIDAPNGIRRVDGVNGENTGQSLVLVPFSAWGTIITGCSMSSSGLVNPYNPDAKPSQYVVMGATDRVADGFCYVAPYGNNPPEMNVRAPGAVSASVMREPPKEWRRQPPSRASMIQPPQGGRHQN